MTNKKSFVTEHLVWLLIPISVILITAIGVLKYVNSRKEKIAMYDSYAAVIGDYCFVLGRNVKCETVKLGDYNRKYFYNVGEDEAIFSYGLFHNSYEYADKTLPVLFKGIALIEPFPDKVLPVGPGSNEFRHYLSKCEPDIVFNPDTTFLYANLSFSRPMSYEEVLDYNEHLNDSGLAIRFCWVDTYLPEDVTPASKFAMGRIPPQTIKGNEVYSDYKTAYGFNLYYYSYPDKDNIPEKVDIDEPAQKFIDIVSASYDDNFMSDELKSIKENLQKKGNLSVDSLEITGVVLEKMDGEEISSDEIQSIVDDNNELIIFAYSS